MFFFVLIVFIICWILFFVFIVVVVLVFFWEKILCGLGIVVYWCGFMNFVINFYLIGLRSEKFYDVFVVVFCCRFYFCKCNLNERKNESINLND